MTHRANVARGRDILVRWCALAEQRLEYLTELFETGRWRRFHSEFAFLENIREARAAVDVWRELVGHEASRNNSTADSSWIGRTKAALSRDETPRRPVHRLQPQPAQIAVEPPLYDVSISAKTDHVSLDEVPSAPTMDAAALSLRLDAIERRYPLLRNVF